MYLLRIHFYTGANKNSIVIGLSATKGRDRLQRYRNLNIVVLNMLLNFLKNIRAFVHHLTVFTILLWGKGHMKTGSIPFRWSVSENWLVLIN